MKAKLIGLSSGLAGFLGLAGGAFAQTPVPIEVDSAVSGELGNLLTSFATQLLSVFGTVIPIAGGVVIAVAVVFGAIKWLRGMIRH
jgi:hypothetical protein